MLQVSPSSAGLLALFLLVLGDSLGVPVPGDSALTVAGGLAADGQLALPAVIAAASTAAFIGDLVMYEIGRRGGRRLLLRHGRFAERRGRALVRAEKFFARYGLAAVFFGKFVPVVRAVGPLAAGATQLSRRGFALVDALACLSWTSAVASFAFAVGPEAALVIAVAGLTVSLTALAVGLERGRRRASVLAAEPASAADAAEGPATSATGARGGRLSHRT